MPPARVADAEVDFTGVRGKAMAHGALFLASLTAAGPLKVARSHWLAKALAKHLGADRPSTKVDVSVRLVAYVFTPAFIFDGALDVLPLPFWPLMARVAKLLRALIDAGMPSEDVGLPRQAQQLVLAFAAKLPLADRALARADVVEVILNRLSRVERSLGLEHRAAQLSAAAFEKRGRVLRLAGDLARPAQAPHARGPPSEH